MPNARGITYGPRVVSDAYDLSTEHVVFNGYENSSTATTSDHLHVGDRTNQFNGEDFISFVERKNIDLGNLTDDEWTGSFYPLVDGTGEIEFSFRTSEAPGVSVDLTAPASRNLKKRTFQVDGETSKVDPNTRGKFLNFRVESENSDSWRLAGYSLSVGKVGARDTGRT